MSGKSRRSEPAPVGAYGRHVAKALGFSECAVRDVIEFEIPLSKNRECGQTVMGLLYCQSGPNLEQFLNRVQGLHGVLDEKATHLLDPGVWTLNN